MKTSSPHRMSFIGHRRISIGLFIVAAAIVCLLLIFFSHHIVSYRNSPHTMSFEVVNTEAAQELGLGGRSVIPDNYGMLFVYIQDGMQGFWMKGMLAPIDMVWLSADGTIISIEGSVSPNSYPRIFYPAHPARYVLETRAGYAQAKGWQIGTKIPLPLPYGK